MRKTIFYGMAVSCLALALVAGLRAQGPKPETDGVGPRRWQHLAFEQDAKRPMTDPDLAKKVNKLGDDGWELVAVDSVQDSGTTTRRIFYFKRPR